MKNRRNSEGKAKRCFLDWPFVYFSSGFNSHLFGDYANINMWKSDNMKAWNSIKNDCGRFVKNQMQRPLCYEQKISKSGQPYFQFPSRQMHKFSYHTTAQKWKKIYSISLENSHKLYLYSTSPSYQYKLKPQHEWADSKSSLIYQENLFDVEVFFHLFVF